MPMSAFRTVPDHFYRKGWNETWEYPITGSLMSIEKDFPKMTPYYFGWEVDYDPIPMMSFTRRNYWLAPLFTALYLIFIFVAPKMMKNRKEFDLRTPLKYWNLFLAIFSFWGALRTVPHVLYFIIQSGFTTTLCTPPVWGYGSGASGIWIMMFVYSKYIELIDTVFIVLRKRNLSFLHWYHHATVLLYSWDGFIVEQPPGIHFCAINFSIHAIMYFYYYLAAVMHKPPNWGILVTTLQILQMIYGVVVTCIALYLGYSYPFIPYTTAKNGLDPFSIPGCYISKANLWGCMAIYSTYFYLFGEFFWTRYLKAKPKSKKN